MERRSTLFVAVAIGIGIGIHLGLVAALDLRDHPGAAGILVLRDVLSGSAEQGIASQAAAVLSEFVAPERSVHLLSTLAAVAAMLGAGLAAGAVGGAEAGMVGALFAAAWSLTATQAWLVGPGTLAWGLAWLGVGLGWSGARTSRLLLVAGGAALAVLAAATKATAAPALVLVALAPLFGERRVRVALSGLGGGLAAVAIATWLQGDATPWVAGTAAGDGTLAAAWTLGERGLRVGALPLVTLAAIGGAVRRRPSRWLVLVTTVALFAGIGHLRGELLHPRHLVVASLGFLALVASLRPRFVAWALVGLALADTLGWATAWQHQRSERIEVAPAELPDVGWFATRYGELPESVFLSLSIADALELAELGAEAPEAGVLIPELYDRRDAHLHVGALLAGRPAGTLSHARCCKENPKPQICAEHTAAAALAAGLRVVAPRVSTLDDDRERAFAMAVARALPVSGRARRSTWLVKDGRGDGPVPCQGLSWQPLD